MLCLPTSQEIDYSWPGKFIAFNTENHKLEHYARKAASGIIQNHEPNNARSLQIS